MIKAPLTRQEYSFFGKILTNEPILIKGEITLTDSPSFGAELNSEVELEEIFFIINLIYLYRITKK
jgi:hypothetical protein